MSKVYILIENYFNPLNKHFEIRLIGIITNKELATKFENLDLWNSNKEFELDDPKLLNKITKKNLPS